MIIQVDNDKELAQLQELVTPRLKCETPCLVHTDGNTYSKTFPIDRGVMNRLSVSVAIDHIKKDKLYEMIREMSPETRRKLVVRLSAVELTEMSQSTSRDCPSAETILEDIRSGAGMIVGSESAHHMCSNLDAIRKDEQDGFDEIDRLELPTLSEERHND